MRASRFNVELTVNRVSKRLTRGGASVGTVRHGCPNGQGEVDACDRQCQPRPIQPVLAGRSGEGGLNLSAARTMELLGAGSVGASWESQPVGRGSGSEYVCRGSGHGGT